MAPEIIDIRQFQAREFSTLLQIESEVWDNDLRWDYAASAQMISNCLEEKRLSGYALVQERRLKGYCFFFYEGDKGLIGNLFVEPTGTRIEHAALLLVHVIETLLATPGLTRVESQLPHFALEQLDPCFRARHFDSYQRRFMVKSWKNQTPQASNPPTGRSLNPEKLRRLLEDFKFEPWEQKQNRAAALLLYHCYRGHVDAVLNDQYGSEAGSSRLVENILHHRGCGEHLPQASQVAIHRQSQKLAGILALTAVRPRTAHIPQIAIAKDFQGTGLGTALLEQSFEALARRGFEEVSLTVTDSNAGAVRLYERLGFETLRTFGAFVWDRHRSVP